MCKCDSDFSPFCALFSSFFIERHRAFCYNKKKRKLRLTYHFICQGGKRDGRIKNAKRKYKYRVQEAKLKAYWIKRAGLPKICAFYAVRPLLIGLLPLKFYKRLHRERLTGR